MTIEDFKRSVRAMNNITPKAKASLIVVTMPDDEVRICTAGDPQEIKNLLCRLSEYIEGQRGGKA